MLLRILLLTLLICLPFSSFGAEDTPMGTDSAAITVKDDPFDLNAANQTLKDIQTEQLAQGKDTQKLQGTISTINRLKIKAKECIDVHHDELDKLSKISPLPLVDTNASDDTPTTPVTVDQKYLDEKRQTLEQGMSQCRLFIIRADELTDRLSDRLRQLLKSKLLYADNNALQNFWVFPANFHRFQKNFDPTTFVEATGIHVFNTARSIVLTISLAFSIVVGFWLRRIFKIRAGDETATKYSYQIKQAALCALGKYIPALLPIFTFGLYMTLIDIHLAQPSYLTLLGYALFIYIIFLSLASFFFYPPQPATTTFSNIPKHLAKSLYTRLIMFATLCLFSFIGYSLFHAQTVPAPLFHASRTIVLTLISINLISVIWIVQRLPKLVYELRVLRFFVNLFLTITLLTILIAEWLGYHQLSYYLLMNIAITILAVFIARLLHKLVKAGLGGSGGTVKGLQEKLKRHLGLSAQQRLIELSCLRVVIYFTIWCGFFLFLLKTWGLGQTNFDRILNALVNGVTISEFDIIPSRIIIAILAFISLAILTRFWKTYMIRHANQHLTRGNRESLGAIVGYVGFTLSALVGLLLAGFNISNLVIIAGALSVGIGFGLQKIVNDFISGIILLIERPIKPGDRIIVGDTEGYVRRVGIRATHIITTQRSDVVVPNSEIVANNLTNYMLYDSNFFVIAEVGIAYGSDTELTKKILLEVANDHPQVISDREGYEPNVYFKAFGDSALDFSLWCLIKDANFKGSIKSALNFEIEKRFRENGIEIAFPQRDIHIRNWTDMPKLPGDKA